MKQHQLIIIASFLTVTIIGLYSTFDVRDFKLSKLQAAPDYNEEITLLKSEINTLKKVNSDLKQIKLEIAQLKIKQGDNVLQATIQKDEAKAIENQQEEEQKAQFNPVEMNIKQEEKQTKDFENMNNAFLAEASDPNWSSETTSLVTTFFEKDTNANIDLSDIQCRKTLCKIEINKSNNTDPNDDFMLRFPMHVAKALSHTTIFYNQNDDGTTRMTLYMARNGFELPTAF